MSRAILVALAALAPASCGFGPLEPNGTDHVLEFQLEPGEISTLAEGLAEDVRLPREEGLVRGCGKLDLTCDRKTLRFDFDGTTLEAGATAGFSVVESALEEAGYRIRVRCDRAPPGGSGELHVRVLAGGSPRYDDRFDLACLHPDGLDLSPESPRYAIGAPVRVVALPWAKSEDKSLHPDGRIPLGGTGFALSSGALALGQVMPQGTWGIAISLDAVAPGTGGVVIAGAVSAPLPLQVLADDAWTLELDSSPCSEKLPEHTVTSVRASVKGIDSDGAPVTLQQDSCSYVFRSADGAAVMHPSALCEQCIDTPSLGTLCASLRGKSACVPVGSH
jgi:hypothetical protein